MPSPTPLRFRLPSRLSPWLLLPLLGGCVEPPLADESGQFFASGSVGSAASNPTVGDDGHHDTGTGGGPLDPQCEMPDLSIDAAVTIDRSAWPVVERGESDVTVDFDAPCTITQVAETTSPIMTYLDCDDEGVSRALGIAIPAAEDPVAWAVGDVVTVAYHYDETLGEAVWRHDVSMRRADDDSLLLAWMDQDVVHAETFAPLVVNIDEEYCGFDSLDFGTWPMQVEIDSRDGFSLALTDRQRGQTVPNVGDGLLTVDVGEAGIGDAYCCHTYRHLRLLVRRTLVSS